MKCTYLFASVALASVTSAQVSVDWVATHDVAPDVGNEFTAVAIDATGRVVVGGNTIINWPMVDSDFETCLYRSNGTLAWSRSTSVSAHDVCSSVAFDGTGGLFVAGAGYTDAIQPVSARTLLRYDAVGNLLWSNTLSGTGSNRGNALALCPNGDVILAGALNSDLSLERFDAAGNILWAWIADGHGGIDHLKAVAVGPGGDVWATGVVRGGPGPGPSFRIVVVRVTSAGVPVWIRTLEDLIYRPGYGHALVVDAAGNTTVAGRAGPSGPDALIARWDPAGNLAWVRTYDGNADSGDYATRIEVDPFGRIVAAGSLENGMGNHDFAVWCLDTAGSLIWKRTWDGGFSGWDDFGDLVVDAMGAVWLCGWSPASPVGAAPPDLTIASWDSTGAFRWSWRYRGAGPSTNRSAVCAAVSGNNVIVAGSVTAGSETQNGLIVKLNRTAVEYCFGDGSSTPCPCANASAPEQHAGCANALGRGARLVDNGRSSLAADTLVLEGSQMSSGDALYFQGTSSMSGGAGELFGDGLSCVGGTLIRLGSSVNVAGASRFPDVGDPSVSVRGLVTTPGSRRTYQVWYRDASVFCTTANFNFSNGLLITWTL